MVRTLVFIPTMYSRDELKRVLGSVPDDFEETSVEFWSYVEEKLTPFINKVTVVYTEKPLEKERSGRGEPLLNKLIKTRAEFHYIEDSLLASEAEAWQELMKNHQNQAVIELYKDSMKERNEYARSVIERTLENGKLGLLLANPERKLPLAEDVKVIKMCPFDPVDYLNRQVSKLKIKERKQLDNL